MDMSKNIDYCGAGVCSPITPFIIVKAEKLMCFSREMNAY
jgi:hypothetical protein